MFNCNISSIVLPELNQVIVGQWTFVTEAERRVVRSSISKVSKNGIKPTESNWMENKEEGAENNCEREKEEKQGN
jgi:uncharacterized membrane-anchored protein